MSACLFCQIIEKKIPSQIIYEDDQIVAFKDINPVAPTHILLIPRKHFSSLNEVAEQDKDLLGHLQIQAARLAQQAGLAEKGYRLVVNCGTEGGQTVAHLHYHLLGGRALQWPPG